MGVIATSIRHLHSGIHGFVLGKGTEACGPTIILTQLEQNKFHTQERPHFTSQKNKQKKKNPTKPMLEGKIFSSGF